MNPLLYDAGALIALERGGRTAWAVHDESNAAGKLPRVPAPVLAQVWRTGPGRQALLSRAVRGSDVLGMTEEDARAVGGLLHLSRTSDVVDALVVVLASQIPGCEIVTSDPDDIRVLLAAGGIRRRLRLATG